MRRTWRPERAVVLADALDRLLDHREPEPRQALIEDTTTLLPHTTGVVGLDHVCDGGLRPGTVTVLDCPLASCALSLLLSTARQTDVPTLLAVADLDDGARWLLAGAAGVPAELIRTRQLSDTHSKAIDDCLPTFAKRDLALTDAPSVAGIGHLIDQKPPTILIVEEPDRLGPIAEVVTELVHVARSTRVAVLTATDDLPELDPWITDHLAVVTVAPHTLASRAALVATGCGDGLVSAQVEIAVLVGVAT